jgi:hypothetical protein
MTVDSSLYGNQTIRGSWVKDSIYANFSVCRSRFLLLLRDRYLTIENQANFPENPADLVQKNRELAVSEMEFPAEMG